MDWSEISNNANQTFRGIWERRNGRVVPDTNSLTLGNTGVDLDATVLYADLRESTSLVDNHSQELAAEVYKTFLWSAAKAIEDEGGVITAYDGDRIMALFTNPGEKNTRAARAALKINTAVRRVIQPAYDAFYGTFTPLRIKQTVGIDTSPLLAAKTGVRGANDLVWVGRAANHAAKLCTLPGQHAIYITPDVYNALNVTLKNDMVANLWALYYWPDKGQLVWSSDGYWTGA